MRKCIPYFFKPILMLIDGTSSMMLIIWIKSSSSHYRHTHTRLLHSLHFLCVSVCLKKIFELVLRHRVILLLIIVILIAIKKYHIFDRLNTYSVVIIKLWSDQKENFVCHQYDHFYYHHNHLLHSIYQYTLPKKIKKGRFFFSVNQVEQWKLSN